jgi:hypothetical protein
MATIGSTLVLTLPTGVTFGNASVSPITVSGSTLTWNTGALAANSGPYTITVTVKLIVDAPKMVNLIANADLQSGNELTKSNNTANARIYVGSILNLPMVTR